MASNSDATTTEAIIGSAVFFCQDGNRVPGELLTEHRRPQFAAKSTLHARLHPGVTGGSLVRRRCGEDYPDRAGGKFSARSFIEGLAIC